MKIKSLLIAAVATVATWAGAAIPIKNYSVTVQNWGTCTLSSVIVLSKSDAVGCTSFGVATSIADIAPGALGFSGPLCWQCNNSCDAVVINGMRTIKLQWRTNATLGVIAQSPEYKVGWYDGQIVYIPTACTTVTATNGTYAATVFNDSGIPKTAFWKLNGAVVNTQTLQAGQSATYVFTYTTCDTCPAVNLNWGMTAGQASVSTGSDGSPSFNWTTTTNSAGDTTFIAFTNGATQMQSNGTIFSYTNGGISGNSLATNGLINFNSTDATAAKDSTLKAGFSMMANDDATTLAALVAIYGKSNAVNVAVTVTNTGGGGSTNAASGGLTNWPVADTNAVNASGHNDSTTATSGGRSGLGGGLTTMEGYKSDVNGVGGGVHAGGNGTAINVPMGSLAGHTFTMNYDIVNDSNWTGLWSLLKTVWTFLLYLAFIYKAGECLWTFLGSLGSAKGGGVPNLSVIGTVLGVGGGGNMLGVACALLVILATLALWATALAAVMAAIVSVVPWATLMGVLGGNILATMNAYGLALLSAIFPIELAFSLTGAYLLVRFSMASAGAVVFAAMKVLFTN